MKKFGSFLAIAILACFIGRAVANCGNCKDKGDSGAQCSTEKCTDDCAGCPISKAMAALPKMTFTVGGKTGCCEQSAKAMAEAADTHMHYVVADEEYDDKSEAMVALADATEKFVGDFSTPHECSKSGNTNIAGTSLSCSKTAAKLAAVAQSAMKTVAMTYKVGDESCHCPLEATKLAKASGEKQQYVIGDDTTCCSVDARIKLARAKYAAAVQAVTEAAQDAEKVAVTSDS